MSEGVHQPKKLENHCLTLLSRLAAHHIVFGRRVKYIIDDVKSQWEIACTYRPNCLKYIMAAIEKN